MLAWSRKAFTVSNMRGKKRKRFSPVFVKTRFYWMDFFETRFAPPCYQSCSSRKEIRPSYTSLFGDLRATRRTNKQTNKQTKRQTKQTERRLKWRGTSRILAYPFGDEFISCCGIEPDLYRCTVRGGGGGA